ncbi:MULTISPECIES: glycoside hydrolase family 13 protein [unclassified Curtobacterium]|uniref:glycoside hydrolase family 13 protein n=1 Tax=unclassified Curtobacterium TaxID=257496 RepID=UPI000D8BBDD1|nr:MULTISPECIES: glycoside hydrolase family 13 protein [unclassified Curtobacterium]PYY37403.1 alpha-amylase [Curtobacterium sp. MCPF17_046]WIB14792.1 glycoside hydrolase family 13 protein [Curtobacterium sp. MCPF17_050]
MTDVLDPAVQPTTPATDETWWRQASVYQIYPRSFADADGDGIGDLRGVTDRVPYLASLGVEAVWLSPFYPSALADGGYDVDDYRDVDPRLGTLDDFDDMVAALHGAGIRVIVDVVPNHTSDRHEWFREALASPKGSPARARYVFRDGTGPSGTDAPADWVSIFGGPAWTPVGDGQWYLHSFAKEQPDLDWTNREVRDDFLRTLRFWSDRGVDGFRIDVAHGLAKDLPAGDLPTWAEVTAMPKDGTHPLWDRDEVHEIYAEWRRVFEEYTPARTAVAEAWVPADRRARYASAEGLGQAFNFDLLEADFDAGQFRSVIEFNLGLAEQSGSSTTWVFSNHDVVRHATRYALPPRSGDAAHAPSTDKQGSAWLLAGGSQDDLDRGLGLRRARAATLLELALPGSAYLYQGEELGLHEVGDVPDAARQDPAYFRNPGVDVGRDGCRVPIPWTRTGESFGFGPGGAHLPQPAWFAESSVEAEDADPDSTLNLYRAALRLRRALQAAEHLEWVETGRDDVLAFRRPNGWTSVTVFGEEPFRLPEGELLLASAPVTDGVLAGVGTAWLRP